MTEDRVGESDLDFCTEPGHRRQPDSIQGGHDGAGRFPRDRQARDILFDCDDSCRVEQAQASRNGRDQNEGDDESPVESDRPDPVRMVRKFLDRHGLEVLFDGAIVVGNAPRMAFSRADAEAYLSATTEVDADWVVDEVMLEVRRRKLEYAAGDIKRAVRKVVREDQKARNTKVMLRLLQGELAPEDATRAEEEWERVVAGVLDEDVAFGIAVLQHFIWQILRKQLGRPISHHLMPIVFSPMQGSGKTTFVNRFLSPLKELAAGPVLLSEFADSRSGELYRFPALFVDDVERIDKRCVPILKALVTGEYLQRRRLGTSRTVRLRQHATLIGTSNEPVTALIADGTGHRRFIDLRFRNGAIAKGGDPAVWPAVDAADYELLWRSVDAFAPSPIEPHLGELSARQMEARPREPVAEWLFQLDPTSEPVVRITTRMGVRAQELYDLFCQQTGLEWTLTRFGMAMNRHAADPASPLCSKIRASGGSFFPIKPYKPAPDSSRHSDPAHPTDPTHPAHPTD